MLNIIILFSISCILLGNPFDLNPSYCDLGAMQGKVRLGGTFGFRLVKDGFYVFMVQPKQFIQYVGPSQGDLRAMHGRERGAPINGKSVRLPFFRLILTHLRFIVRGG